MTLPSRPLRVVLPAARGRQRRHGRALSAAALYAVAAGVAVGLVDGALERDGDVSGVAGQVAASEAPIGARATGPEILTMRTLAARAQQSVFTIESSGGSTGSGLVAWVAGGRSYVLTARALLDGVLADGFDTVFVRRGRRFWTAEIVGVDRTNALALLRVETRIGDLLWQTGRSEPLGAGDAAVIVPAGPNAALRRGPRHPGRPRPARPAHGRGGGDARGGGGRGERPHRRHRRGGDTGRRESRHPDPEGLPAAPALPVEAARGCVGWAGARTPSARCDTLARAMPWKALTSEGARAVAAIVIAIAVAIASWQLVGKPSAQQNERQSNALAYQAEARASIEEFERARPNESAALVAHS